MSHFTRQIMMRCSNCGNFQVMRELPYDIEKHSYVEEVALCCKKPDYRVIEQELRR